MSSWPALHRSHKLLTDINGFVFAFFAGGGSSCGEWKRSGCVLSLEEDALVFLEPFPGFGGILVQVEFMPYVDEFPRQTLSSPSKAAAEEVGELVKSRASLRARVAHRRCVSRARVPGQSRSQARRNSRVCPLLLPPTMIVPLAERDTTSVRICFPLPSCDWGLALRGLAVASRAGGYCRRD